MSSADLEIVAGLIEAWNADDWEAIAARLHPEIVGVPPEGWPEGREDAVGAEAMLAQFRRLKESWEKERIEIDELREEEAQIVMLGRWVTRGQNSGIEMEVRISIRAELRDALIWRAEFGVENSAAPAAG